MRFGDISKTGNSVVRLMQTDAVFECPFHMIIYNWGLDL